MTKAITEERECATHGTTTHAWRAKESRWRCRKCNVDAVSRRRERVKVELVKYAGGSCDRCGYDRCPQAMDFHHIDPETKSFGLAHKGLTRSLARLKEEADKCLLLCANCHRELHACVWSPES